MGKTGRVRISLWLLVFCAVTGSVMAQTISHDDGEDEPTPAEPDAGAPPRRAPQRPHFPLKDGMILIPAGSFTMGATDKAAAPNERPPRTVTVPSFWLDRTEVTVGAYRACVERGACTAPGETSAQCTYQLRDPELPVSCVRWQEADTFCRVHSKRLPTETEWEFAARGTASARYPWGGHPPNCTVAVTLYREVTARSCSKDRPARVGTHALGASPFGVLDMAGNVEEWVADWYAESPGAAPRAGSSHVLRGGGWLSSPSMARASARNWGSVIEAGPNVGFRCARDP